MAPKHAAGPDDIQAPGAMKAVLAVARHGEAVSCAVALTKDKDGVVLVDRKRRPKQVMAELKKQAGAIGVVLDAATIRFGRASVDGDADAGLLTLAVNKEAPSAMRPKLLVQLEKAGFARVELTTDAALEQEADDAPAAATEGSAAPAPAAGTDADAGTARSGAAAEAGHGGGDLSPTALASVEKARQIWAATLRNVEGQVNALHKDLAEAYKDHPFAEGVDDFVAEHIRGALDTLHDPRLEQALAAVGKAATPEQRKQLLQAAVGILERHKAHLDGDPSIAELDNAPFGSPTIYKTLAASLAATQSAVRALVNTAD